MSEASSTGSYGPIEPGRLVEERVARFYVRLGLVVAIAIGAASALVWTGTFERMLTWGDWGMLSDEDLMGFLTVMMWVLAVGMLVVLFTLKRAMSRVEVQVRERDTDLAAHVHDEEKRFRHLLTKAEERLRDEHARLQALADASRRRDEEVLVGARAEIGRRVGALRHELLDELARLHAEDAALAAKRDEEERARAALEGAVATEGDHLGRLARLVRREAEVVRAAAGGFEARLRALEGGAGRVAQRAADQEDELQSLRGAFDAQRAELFTAVDARMHDAITAGVNDRIRQAVEVAFHPGRFYRVLAYALAGGVALTLLLAFAGATGPGFFTVGTATFALGLVSAVLAAATLVLIWSFTGAIRTLRAFTGSPMRDD